MTEHQPSAFGVCDRCGNGLSRRDTGRPRQFCGDACRQAGSRLRRAIGTEWWTQQPWYPQWNARREREYQEHEQARAQKKHQADEDARLLRSMPDEARKAYDAARDADNREPLKMLKVALDVDKLAERHRHVLRDAGYQISLVRGSSVTDKLLRAAVTAENDHEAQALFAKAREMCTVGQAPDLMTLHEHMRKLLTRARI